MRTIIAAALAAGLLFTGGAATAATVEVKMLNKGHDGHSMSFEPGIITANVGDTIKFVAVDKFHSIESIDEMLPAGVAPFAGQLNKDFELKLDKPGVYGIKCTPHMTMGMIGLIVVGGDKSNLDAVKKGSAVLEGKAKERMDALLAKL